MNNKTSLILLLLLAISLYTLSNLKPIKQTAFVSFQQFKHDFNKTYSSPAEQSYRKIIFSSNQNKINIHNSDPNLTFKLGVTQFADLTQEEFVKIYLTSQNEFNFASNQNILVDSSTRKIKNLHDQQNDIDWASRGYVTPVRNQGMCGSCYAFSTTGAVQSLYSILKNDKTILSEQQIIDCSSSYGNNGCNGGRLDGALAYIKDHGLSTEKEYPYVARNNSCKKDYGNYKISNFVAVPQCSNLYIALQQRPISAGVDASTWALYKEGVLTICGRNINHGVLVVGATDGYWKIKNSWGTSWGENGYIRIGRGNTCGVCQTPFYPAL